MYARKLIGSFELRPYARFSGRMCRKLINVRSIAIIVTARAIANFVVIFSSMLLLNRYLKISTDTNNRTNAFPYAEFQPSCSCLYLEK